MKRMILGLLAGVLTATVVVVGCVPANHQAPPSVPIDQLRLIGETPGAVSTDFLNADIACVKGSGVKGCVVGRTDLACLKGCPKGLDWACVKGSGVKGCINGRVDESANPEPLVQVALR